MSILNGDILDPGLKFIQLKNYQFTTANESNSGQCFAIDQKNQIVFACCKNELVYVPFNSLLNFDIWTKELLKTVDVQLAAKVVIKTGLDSVSSHLLSISGKGHGSKLLLSSFDRSQASLYITFYDLNSLYQNKEKAAPYSRFNFSVTGHEEVQVRMLQWHPEMSDNIFACSLTNGSFYVAYISDSDRNVLTVLANYSTPRHVTSFAWSPKGKQIVVAFRDASFSHFSQFKLPINENNLVQNTPFEEVKKINLTDEFKGYYVTNICWLSTFNFIIVCHNVEENDTRYMLVSIPSAKATGDDAIMKIVDFSCINIDYTDENVLEVNLLQLENIIFTYTNRSSNFGLLGCPTINDVGKYSKWAEITLEDTSTLCLPALGDESYVSIRGLAFAPGTQKQLQFASSISKGGPERHFALTYNAFGHLTLFMCDFETPESANFLKIPTAPATLIKPNVSPNVQNQAVVPNLPIQSNIMPIAMQKPPASTGSILSQALSNSSNLSFAAKSTFNFAPTNLPDSQPSLSDNTAASVNTVLPKKDSALASLLANTSGSAKPPQTSPSFQVSGLTQQPKQPPQALSATTLPKEKAEPNMDQLYMEEIKSNIDEFDKEFKLNVRSLKTILSGTDIGTSDQFEKIKYEFDFINRMLENLAEQFTSLNVDINELQSTYMDLHYMCEETRSLLDRNTDHTYRHILRQRNLDPITSRKVKEIHSLRDYIDVQLRELDSKFDLEWKEWLQKKCQSGGGNRGAGSFLSPSSKTRLTRMPPTAPHLSFITNKSAETANGINENEQHVGTIINKMLNNNQRLIDSLKRQVKEINASLLTTKDCGGTSFSLNDSINGSKNVSNNLSKMFNDSLSLSNSKSIQQTKKTVVTCLEPTQKASLKSFLENRHSVPIRVCGPCPDGYSGKSRFVSLLEKIKKKKPQATAVSANFTLAAQSKANPSNTLVAQPVTKAPAIPQTIQPVKSSGLSLPALTAGSLSFGGKTPASLTAQVKTGTSSSSVFGTSAIKPPTVASTGSPIFAPPLNTSISGNDVVATSGSKISSQSVSSQMPFSFGKPLTSTPAIPSQSSIGFTLDKASISSPSEPAKTSTTSQSDSRSSFGASSTTINSFNVSTTPSLFGGSTVKAANSIFSTIPKISEEKKLQTQFPVTTDSVDKPSISGQLISSNKLPPEQVTKSPSTKAEPIKSGLSLPAVTGSFSFGVSPSVSVNSTVKIGSQSSSIFGTASEKMGTTMAPAGLPITITTPLNSPPTTTAATTIEPKAPFSFSKAISAVFAESNTSSSSSAQSVGTMATTTSVVSQSSKPVTFSFNKALTSTTEGAKVTNASSSLFGSGSFSFGGNNSSVPSSSSSLFGSPSATVNATITSEASPATSQPVPTATSPENKAASFSFLKAASTIVVSTQSSTFPSAITSVTTSVTTLSQANPSFSFGNLSICSPNQAAVSSATGTNAFGSSFSFGGNAAPSAATSNAPTPSLFGSTVKANNSTPADSIFSSSILNSSSWSSPNSQLPGAGQGPFSTPVQNKTGPFGGFQAATAVGGGIGFGSPAKFGNSPVFGQSPGFGNTQAFGGSPTFGGAATFGSTSPFSGVGSSSPFGGPVGGQAPFSNFNPNESFSGGHFEMNGSDIPSFGSIAGGDTGGGQPQSPVAFNQPQAQQQQPFNSPSFGHDASFMQRRK